MKTYRTSGHALIAPGPTRRIRDLTAREIALHVAAMTADYGKPSIESKTVVAGPAKGQPITRFTFAPDSINGQEFSVTGLTIDEIRAEYRAAKAGSSDPAPATVDPARVDPNTVETCGRCGGSGIYYGAGYIENGVFKGYRGTCYRCKGKGTCTHAQNELGERGRGDYAGRQMAAEIRAAERESGRCRCSEGYTCDECAQHWTGSDHDDPKRDEPNAVECVDCGTAPAGSIRVYCPAHAKARYDERSGRFDHGDTIPTHDDVIGKPWEATASPRARAARRERYTAQKPNFKIGLV